MALSGCHQCVELYKAFDVTKRCLQTVGVVRPQSIKVLLSGLAAAAATFGSTRMVPLLHASSVARLLRDNQSPDPRRRMLSEALARSPKMLSRRVVARGVLTRAGARTWLHALSLPGSELPAELAALMRAPDPVDHCGQSCRA